MAQYTVTYDYDFETQSIEMSTPSGGSNSFARLKLKRSDTVIFRNNSTSYSGVSEADANKFSPTSFTVSPNSSTTMTVLSSAALGQDNLTIGLRSKTKVLYVEVISSTDTTPTPFDMGKPVFAADLSTSYTFESFVVKGINAATSLTTQNCKISVNGSAPTSTTSTVNYNDVVYAVATSASGYAQQTQSSITIGGVTDYNYITTKNNPNAGARIYFPKTSRPLSLKNVTEFFAAPVSNYPANAPRNMSAYRRGGLHVPNIPENSGITDTNQANSLKLGMFLGSATTVYFERYPANKSDFQNTINSSRTAAVSWNANSDWALGFSPLTKYNVEYRYEITENTGAIYGSGVTFNSNTGSPGTYNNNNYTFSVNKTSAANTEREYSGIVKIFMRSIINPALVLTAEVSYTLEFYGP